MYKYPQILSFSQDMNYFKEVIASEFKETNNYIFPSDIVNYLANNQPPDTLILAGKTLDIEGVLSLLSDVNVNISLEIENSKLQNKLNIISKLNKRVYQIRFPFYLHEITSNKNNFYNIINNLYNTSYRHKVIIIYLTRSSLESLDELDGIVSKLIKLNFMVCIFPLPYYFLIEDERIEKKEFWEIADIVNMICEKLGSKVYGDFPVCGSIYSNLMGVCPSCELLMNISSCGKFTPCRFSNLVLGNIKNTQLEQAWSKWKNIKSNKFNSCDRCKNYLSCRGGCIANWYNNGNYDYYCRDL